MIGALARHQIEAVQRLLDLLTGRGGAVLADEPGLGKSWVAAAVAREFRRRGTAVELILPRALVSQWTELLRDFEVDAEIITHDSLHGSFTFPGAAQRLLIVDEAHRFRNPATNRHAALSLRAVGAHLLLVTATPICNRLRDFQSLLRLISSDDGLASDGVPSVSWAFENVLSDQLAAIRRQVVVRRSRESLPDELQFGALRREVIRFVVCSSPEQVGGAIATLRFPLVAATDQQSALLRHFLWRRLESSAAALLDTVRRQKRFYHRARESLRRGLQLTRADYRVIFGSDEDQVLFQDVLFEQLWATSGATGVDSGAELELELRRLDALESLVGGPEDKKCDLLLNLVRESSEPILIFTGAVATARFLFRACSQVASCGLLTSKFRCSKRAKGLTIEQVLDAFTRGETRVLVLTDIGAEGLNLQVAGVVVHYDLPWNPVRIEQRNGRIHRIGQARQCVRAVYFLPEREADRVVMRRVVAKNRIRRAILDSDEVRRIAVSHAWVRPRLSRTDPQATLTELLDRKRLLSDRAASLLTRRYRAGAELILRQMCDEFLDAGRRDYLVDVLERELEVTGARER